MTKSRIDVRWKRTKLISLIIFVIHNLLLRLDFLIMLSCFSILVRLFSLTLLYELYDSTHYYIVTVINFFIMIFDLSLTKSRTDVKLKRTKFKIYFHIFRIYLLPLSLNSFRDIQNNEQIRIICVVLLEALLTEI